MVTSLPLDAASSTIARMMKIIMIPTMTAVSRTGLRQGLNIMAVTIISLDAKRILQRFRYVTGADNKGKVWLYIVKHQE